MFFLADLHPSGKQRWRIHRRGFRMKRLLTFCIFTLIITALITEKSHAQDCNESFTLYGSELTSSGSVTYGREIYEAGDVDNDGHPDILVVAPGGHGKAIVYSGFTGDTIRVIHDDINTIRGAGGFGYFDADQYADILINGVIYSGLTGDTLANYFDIAQYGISISDLNNDGKFDILVGDRNWSNTDGRVVLLSGANGDTLRSWEGLSGSGEWFGHSIAVVGDLNNDNIDDFIVGAPKYDYNGTDKGEIYYFSGATGSRLSRRVGPGIGYQFGTNVAGAGDVNNDGYADILVSGHSNNSSGPKAVWVYSGQTKGLLYTLYGNHGSDEFGLAMDGIGDINQDGHDDFAVGANRYDFSSSFVRNRGNVYIYSGIDGSLLQEMPSPDLERFGTAICGLGDIDGNGDPDFAVGAVWGTKVGDPNNQFRGAVYVYTCPLATDIGEEIVDALPEDFNLKQNYPNPFNPETVLEYSVKAKSHVALEIFNITGQKVRTLVNETVPAGSYRIVWDGRDETTEKVSSGIYLYRLTSDNFTETKKMVLLK